MFDDTRPAALDAHKGAPAWADFRVGDHGEAVQLLQRLRDGDVPVVLSTPHGVAVTSQLWSLDPVREQLSFSADASSPRLQLLAESAEVAAVGYLDHVKLQFDLSELLLVHGASSSVLRSRWPQAIYRLQRRSSYRVRTLQRHAPKARLRPPAIPDMQLALRIIDVSVDGCALGLDDDVPALQPGITLQGVRIELDGDTAFTTGLQVQHVSSLQPGHSGVRLGCRMLQLDAHAQRALQRYIDRTQHRRRLLSRP